MWCVLGRQNGKVVHDAVAPCINALGEAAAPLNVVRVVEKCGDELKVMHMHGWFVGSGKGGWVSKSIVGEWAEFFCSFVDEYGVRLKKEGHRGLLLLDNSRKGSWLPALWTFAAERENVRVVIVSGHDPRDAANRPLMGAVIQGICARLRAHSQ
jgi:hypothetical protein